MVTCKHAGQIKQMPEELRLSLLALGESRGNLMKLPGSGTWPHGLLAGFENVTHILGADADLLLPCTQVMLVLA